MLLETAPIAEHTVVAGKFLGAWTFLLLLLALSTYLPALVLVNGSVTVGHIAAGPIVGTLGVPWLRAIFDGERPRPR